MKRAVALVVLLLFVGCSHKGELKQVQLSSIPETTTNLFQTAQPALRDAAFQAASLVAKGYYPQAWQMYQGLSTHPDLNEQQKQFIGAAVATLGEKVSEMAARGDRLARRALQRSQINK